MKISNNFSKIDISKILSKKTGYSLHFSKKILEDLILIFKSQIKNNGLILKNFGTLKIKKKKERMGRNPKTGENLVISSRNVIIFNAAKKMIDKINTFY